MASQDESVTGKIDIEAASDVLINTVYESLRAEDGFKSIIRETDPLLDQLDSSAKDGTNLFGRIRNHLENAIGLIGNLSPPAAEDPIGRAIRRSPAPALAISDRLTVISCNVAAAEAYAVRSGSQTDLAWLDPQSREQLWRLLKGDTRQTAILYRASSGLAAQRLVQATPIDLPGSSKPVALISQLSANWSEAAGGVLKDAYGLTGAEVEISAAFFRDPNTERIAKSRSVSAGTIRTQLKSIYLKTGASNQTELHQLLGLIVQSKAENESGDLDIWRDPLGNETVLLDDGGRRVAYTWMGAEDGLPMLLCHGSMTGYLFTIETREALAKAGIKIFVVCRPGYGSSDPYPELDAVSGACRYIETVLGHLGLADIPAIGFASGIVPLIAFAARRPGRIRRLLSFGGGIPLNDTSEYHEFPRNVRVLLGLHKQAPQLAKLAIRAGYRQVIRQGPEYMVQTIYGVAPGDRTITTDADMLALLTASARMLTVHGTDTFERELALQTYGWESDYRAAGVPMHCLVGSDDPLFLATKCRELASRLEGYTVEEAKNCGQLVYLQAPEQVLETILLCVEPRERV